MPQISTFSLSQMTDTVNRTFTEAQENLPQVMYNADFVVKDPIQHGTGDSRILAERVHTNNYASIRDEGASSATGSIQYGYEKALTAYTVSLEISITKRMRDAGKDREILDKIVDLTEKVPNTRELDLAHRITFAHSTSYVRNSGQTIDTTLGDGLALANAAHTLTGSATTYSTIVTGNPAFSRSALETAERSFVEGTFNNLGEKMAANPDTIVTTDDPVTINAVKELMNSTAITSDNKNEGVVNVYQSKYKHVAVPLIATTAVGAVDTSKRLYWALVDSRLSDFYIMELNKPYIKAPGDGKNGEDFSSENWNYLTAGDYGIAIVTGRAWRISKGDAS